jgi:hypothetical protein
MKLADRLSAVRDEINSIIRIISTWPEHDAQTLVRVLAEANERICQAVSFSYTQEPPVKALGDKEIGWSGSVK